jgi:hypothetical protein
MKRIVCVVGLLFAGQALGTGPVGQYLGYRLGIQAVSQSWNKDSLHLTLPAPYDTVITGATLDTTVLESELLYRGWPGYLFHVTSWANGSPSTTYDTTYESTGVYLKRRVVFTDTQVSVTQYKIPFTIGSWWRTGIEGTYYVDFGHNDTIDTIRIWADTARVIARETVTTPYGTVPDCYKIVSRSNWCVSTIVSGVLMRDSMVVTDIEWYKDSLWSIKDSAYSEGKIYARLLGFWLRAGSSYIWGRRELLALSPSGIASEPAAITRGDQLTVEPNPFPSYCVIRAPDRPRGNRLGRVGANSLLRVFDSAGRLVFTAPIRDRIVWQPRGVPPGIYHLEAETPAGERHSGRAVYLK